MAFQLLAGLMVPKLSVHMEDKSKWTDYKTSGWCSWSTETVEPSPAGQKHWSTAHCTMSVKRRMQRWMQPADPLRPRLKGTQQSAGSEDLVASELTHYCWLLRWSMTEWSFGERLSLLFIWCFIFLSLRNEPSPHHSTPTIVYIGRWWRFPHRKRMGGSRVITKE